MTRLESMWKANSSFDSTAKTVPNLSLLYSFAYLLISFDVLKTHRLSLDVPENDMGPNVPNIAPASTSRIIAGSLVVKDLLEHFGGFRKNDPSLQWEFGQMEFNVEMDTNGEARGGDFARITMPEKGQGSRKQQTWRDGER